MHAPAQALVERAATTPSVPDTRSGLLPQLAAGIEAVRNSVSTLRKLDDPTGLIHRGNLLLADGGDSLPGSRLGQTWHQAAREVSRAGFCLPTLEEAVAILQSRPDMDPSARLWVSDQKPDGHARFVYTAFPVVLEDFRLVVQREIKEGISLPDRAFFKRGYIRVWSTPLVGEELQYASVLLGNEAAEAK